MLLINRKNNCEFISKFLALVLLLLKKNFIKSIKSIYDI